MIIIDLDMINITKTPHVQITLLALLFFQPHLVININLTLVLANAPLAKTIPLLDAINHHTALLLNPVPIAIEVDLTLSQRFIQIPKINLPINLSQQPVPNFHHSSSTEPTFEIKIYHPQTSSCSQGSNNQANAITPSIWFVNLYLFEPPVDTFLLSNKNFHLC